MTNDATNNLKEIIDNFTKDMKVSKNKTTYKLQVNNMAGWLDVAAELFQMTKFTIIHGTDEVLKDNIDFLRNIKHNIEDLE